MKICFISHKFHVLWTWLMWEVCYSHQNQLRGHSTLGYCWMVFSSLLRTRTIVVWNAECFLCFITFYLQLWNGPEKGEMESGPVTNVGPPPHSESHINKWTCLINALKSDYLSNKHPWKFKNNKSAVQLNWIPTFLFTHSIFFIKILPVILAMKRNP
jgi:hypothetical protein